ncbi:ParB/RepB/Spo0J family partition protein [Leptolyngbya sp. FACHB-671]|uniref:ParB/RepB/Spo0J family partition protein n=1 Tax=Leptolyngbya sp. FACHB-671 TaxID=2692812 RepID=UPI0016891E42|nr:ParB/RepB/Spo0J family partition protein [Leptolyngbya sp. FACHB-671]MBD1866452.1 ParB/RepB/Spo0J family partition protein [Cyanobacteria bacterium FACHB-471]MBD2068932.1 ParB/RepB/Spo0J family partition protein [Leptolyngbya sp. FACHB-671]
MSTKRQRTQYSALSGVNAFLSSGSKNNAEQSANTTLIGNIQLPHRQPRRYFDPVKMEQLTQSVKEHGILEPLLVRRLVGDEYELVAGERRYRAAQEAGLDEVPISVRELNDEQALQIALIENLQREDLNPIEETEGILDLLAITLQISREEVISTLNTAAHAKRKGEEIADNVIRKNLDRIEKVFALVGTLTPESFRTNRLPLLNLPEEILEALRTGKLEYTKARAIAKLKDPEQRQRLLEKTVAENLSLTQVKQEIKQQSPLKTEPLDFNRRISNIEQVIRRKGLLNDVEKRQEIDKLLKSLESLIGG